MTDPEQLASLGIPVAPAIEGTTHLHSGKVRDLYRIDAGEHAGRLLMVASDRISAYDFVLGTTIPDKGEILTRMSLWWFGQLADLVPNHVVSTDVPEVVRGRAVVCEPLEMFPVECVARGYLTGSGLADYRATGEVCGIALPPGLEDGSRLPEPVFTPATKAELGDHDENVSYDAVVATIGADAAAELRRLTLAVYGRAEQVARERGIVLADTKLEFGVSTGSTGEGPGSTGGGPGSTGGGSRRVVLGDEVLTPDSSRFWPADEWQPGRTQPSYDKQIVRNWLTGPESGWDKASGEAPPPLPEAVVAHTRARYVEAYERLTGERF
ncbi:phosphoribosylaminoimidazolesuccinocarboxamide synthase [Nocardioides solisilvae]|uniref:phosphoribosylaminoimidazolesuccinocarboxamide synthase n=1 Tax=Nocardioides solisilvae TaxID=1542435 RepID=UPI003B84B722